MNFQVRRSLKGCAIDHDGNAFSYVPRLFSMSGELKDSSGDILAVMKRTGWWGFTFEINTQNEKYHLTRKWGNTILTSQNLSIEYETNGTVEFYIKGSKRATKFEVEKWFMNTWSLEILVKEHWHALLLASCFIHKLDIQSHGT